MLNSQMEKTWKLRQTRRYLSIEWIIVHVADQNTKDFFETEHKS